MIQTSFLEIVLAVVVGGLLAKLASLLIDALVWLRSVAADVASEVCKKRHGKK